jgi:predicted dehydrogenase
MDLEERLVLMPTRVGLVGVGFMGWIHYLAYQRSKSSQLVAFASTDPLKRQGDWRSIRGNFGPPGETIAVDSLRVYESIEQICRDPEIDLIDVCLPPHLHESACILAMESGKDVLCEKPLALSDRSCEAILGTAQRLKRRLFVAHVLPWMGPFRFATQAALTGEYGKVVGGTFKRVISNPDWIADFYRPDRVGGPMIDLHVHDTHWIRMLFGMPKSVVAVGSMQGEVAKYGQVLYRFEDSSIAVSSTSGVIDGPGRPFTHGFELHFEQATMQFEFAAYDHGQSTVPLRIIPRYGESFAPSDEDIGAGSDEISAFQAEIDEVAECISSGRPSPILDGKLAADAIRIANAIQASVKTGTEASIV